jgi:hypothetical protein
MRLHLSTTRRRTRLAALALGGAVTAAVAAWPAGPARADSSKGEGWDALFATIPGTGPNWQNGTAGTGLRGDSNRAVDVGTGAPRGDGAMPGLSAGNTGGGRTEVERGAVNPGAAGASRPSGRAR